jgi:hypothetical protein
MEKKPRGTAKKKKALVHELLRKKRNSGEICREKGISQSAGFQVQTGNTPDPQYNRNNSTFVKFKAENIQYDRKSSAQSIVAAASGGGNGELS